MKFLQKHFLTGLLAITPLAITSWILWRVYLFVSAAMGPLLARIPALTETYPDFFLTLVGALAFVLCIVAVGVVARNVIGVALFKMVERFFARIPVVKSVFSATKQIAEVFLQDRRTAFQKVVIFEYPRPGMYSLGFVTHDDPDDPLLSIFLATTPNPTSGFMLLVPRRHAQVLPMAVEDAIKLVVSGGAVMTSWQATLIGDGLRGGASAGMWAPPFHPDEKGRQP